MNHQHPFGTIPLFGSNSDDLRAILSESNHDALALLERIEDVAAHWCVALEQQQQPQPDPHAPHQGSNHQEYTRATQFCRHTLQQIVASRHRRQAKDTNTDTDTGDDLQSTPATTPATAPTLPSWKILPGTVLALDFWYRQVARRCQYRESALHVAGRLAGTTHQQQQQQQQHRHYIQVCEAQAKSALMGQVPPRNVSSGTSTTQTHHGNVFVTPQPPEDPVLTEGVNFSIVGAAKYHVQQCLSTRAAATAKVTATETKATTNVEPQQQQQPNQSSLRREERVDRSSPQSVVLLDSHNCWVPAIVPQPSPVKTKHPQGPTKITPHGDNSGNIITPNFTPKPIITMPPTTTKASALEHMEPTPSASEILASLFHASRCPHPPTPEASSSSSTALTQVPPCFFENCAAYKNLWCHIVENAGNCQHNNSDNATTIKTTTSSVKQQQQQQQQQESIHHCDMPHCLIAKQALRHFRKCKQKTCIVCGPVLHVIPKLKQDMELVQRHGLTQPLPQPEQLLCPQVYSERLQNPPQQQDRIPQDSVPVREGEDNGINNFENPSGNAEVVASINNITTISADAADAADAAGAADPNAPRSKPSPVLSLSLESTPAPRLPSSSPLRRSAFKRTTNRGPLKKRHRVKFAGSSSRNGNNYPSNASNGNAAT